MTVLEPCLLYEVLQRGEEEQTWEVAAWAGCFDHSVHWPLLPLWPLFVFLVILSSRLWSFVFVNAVAWRRKVRLRMRSAHSGDAQGASAQGP